MRSSRPRALARRSCLPIRSTLLCAAASCALAVPAAAADPEIGGRVGLGIAVVPEYEGSSDFDIVPLAFARLDYGPYYVETRGLGVRVNLSPLEGVEAGPVLAYRGSRDDDVSSSRVAAMAEIDGAVEFGAFYRYSYGNITGIQDNLSFEAELRADVTDSHEGITISGGAQYDYALSEQFRVGASLQLTYAGENYTQTYFGVTASDATASGFSQYDAEGGLKDVGLALTGTYALSETWGLFGVIGYNRLVGDAADSPIVTEEGRPNQFFGGLAITYKF